MGDGEVSEEAKVSYADLPPNACYVPELHLEDFWRVRFDNVCLLMRDAEFVEFVDRVKYDGVEYEAEYVRRTPEYYDSRPEAKI